MVYIPLEEDYSRIKLKENNPQIKNEYETKNSRITYSFNMHYFFIRTTSETNNRHIRQRIYNSTKRRSTNHSEWARTLDRCPKHCQHLFLCTTTHKSRSVTLCQRKLRNKSNLRQEKLSLVDYGHKVLETLKAAGIRAEIDTKAEKIGYKIREARLQKIPYMLVVGAKEEEEGKVSVRSRFLGDEGAKDLQAFIDDIKKEIADRTIRQVEVEG